jgi:NADPH:quinone reductase-like Zn-dependent oxidoreductase
VHALARAGAEGAAKAGGQVVVEAAANAVNPFEVVLSSGTFVSKPALPCVAGSDGTGRCHGGARRKTLVRI